MLIGYNLSLENRFLNSINIHFIILIIGSPSRALLDCDAPFALLLFSERKIHKKADNSIDPRISGTDIDLVSADGAIGRGFEALNHAMVAESVFTIPGYGLLCCNKIKSINICTLF